jgi:hypothetical protein
MKHNTLVYLATGCITITVAAGLWAQSANSASVGSSPQKWQHLALEQDGMKIVGDADLARKINQLGSDGWELVDVETIVDSGLTKKTVFFFKRPQ